MIMDSSATNIDDAEPFFHLSSASANPRSASTTSNKQSIDFLTDDVLPDYDFQQQQRRPNTLEQGPNNGRRHRSSGSPVYLTGELYPARKERDGESNEDLIVSAVEQTIKKYADNILKYLEGMSGRLSHLESVTHVLEHSIASLKASVDEYHAEADVKTRLLNENIREMHRGVQILRDRQDIIETQAELAKLQASKADILVEKNKIATSGTTESSISSQSVVEEKQSSALVSKKVQVLSSNQSQVPHFQVSETTGQLHNLSSSSDLNTVPQQQYLSAQSQIQHSQQPHGHLQLISAQSQQSHGLQTAPVHGTVQQSQKMDQTSMVLQQPESVQPQVMSQHLQLQQTAGGQSQVMPQLQNLSSSSDLNTVPQQQYLSAQSQVQHSQQPHGQLLISAQSQKSHGLQTVPVHGTLQQPQTLNQTSIALQQPESVQPQVMSQHLQMQPTGGGQSQVMSQNSSQSPNIQYISSSTISPTQTTFQTQQLHQGLSAAPQQVPVQSISQPQQIHAPVNSQLHGQHLPQTMPPANQMFLPAQHNPTIQPQGVPTSSMQVGPGIRAYSSGNPVPFQQQKTMTHLPQSPQPNSNHYQRNPGQISGPQPVYAAQPAGPNTHLLPVAQTVYGQAVSGGRSDTLSQDNIIDKVAAMGYPREQVRSVIRGLIERGQSVDVNAVLDILMNGEKQPRRAWPVR